MPEVVVTSWETNKTVDLAEKSKLILKKRIIVEAQLRNTDKVYVALSYDYTGKISTKFEPLNAGEVRFYGAPPEKTIYYVWFYVQSGTQYLNYVASDGTITRPRSLTKTFPEGKPKIIHETHTVTAGEETQGWFNMDARPAAGKAWIVMELWAKCEKAVGINWGYYDGSNEIKKPAIAVGADGCVSIGDLASVGNLSIFDKLVLYRDVYARVWMAGTLAANDVGTVDGIVLEIDIHRD